MCATILVSEQQSKPYTPAELADLVAQLQWDRVTYLGRLRAARRAPMPEKILFANALRQAAHLWHNSLTEQQRDTWKLLSTYNDGARPGRKPCPPNGWDIFAQYALAPLMFSALEPPDLNPADRPSPETITFDHALVTTLELQFTATFYFPPGPNLPSFFFIYQVRPDAFGKPGALRYTNLAGYTDRHPEEGVTQVIKVTSVWALQWGDPVQCLVRHHCPEQCVWNFDLTTTAT